jgi:hypothetical protein
MSDFRLLAGPIIRRAEAGRVFFWIATDAQVRAQAKLYVLPETYESGDQLQAIAVESDENAGTRTMRLGERLFLTLVAAQPQSGSFPTNQLLAYDLTLDGKSLDDLGLLSGPQRINYDGLPLPTFFLSDEIGSFLHGSCRNLGGPGLDAMPTGDELLAVHWRDLRLRPSLLILDGDQIYADHLPAPLIRNLTRFGNELMGWQEMIPGVSTPLAEIPVNGRQELAAAKAKFTSEAAHNQLMAFGEYAALYLLAWNVENWPDAWPTFPEESQADRGDFLHEAAHLKKSLSPLDQTPEQAYSEKIEILERVRDGVPAVRRLLANIPTYMMFDDHDVTDDLFITRKWKQAVWDSPTGRRIVTNGLAAAWAFQCWGNEPDRFPPDFIETVLDHLQRKAQDKTLAERYENKIWNFRDWTYALPVHPTTIVMNTRTQRGYDGDEDAPRLIDQQGLEEIQSAARRAGYQDGDPLVLVSPAPVVGYETVEGMQELVNHYIGPYKFDVESWRANLDGYLSLFKYLITELAPHHVIFVSGDVHYGFTISATFTWQGKSLPVVQLTSSALKNTGFALEVIGLSSLFAGRTDRHFGWESLAEEANEAEVGTFPEPATPLPAQGESHSRKVRGRAVHILPNEQASMPATFAPTSGIESPSAVKGRLAWQDARTFEPTWGFRSLPIVGDNNLGLVRFRSGNLLVHRLLVPTEAGTRSSTAIVATVPGEVVLERI